MSGRIAVAIVAGALLALVGCGGDSGGETVAVELRDYEITANPLVVAAGEVTFDVENAGGLVHELAVVRTDIPAEGLPTTAGGTVDEAALDVVDRIELGPAESGALSAELAAGPYALICNLPADPTEGTPAHYAQRMFTSLEVTQ